MNRCAHWRAVLAAMVVVCWTSSAFALTRAQANAIVLNNVIVGNQYEMELAAYSYDPPGPAEFLVAGEIVSVFDDSINVAIAADTWLFFLDYKPASWFVHPCAIVLVDDATGAFTVIDVEWFPTINGVDVYASLAERIASPDLFFGDPNPPPALPPPGGSSGVIDLTGGKWAILVAGPAMHPASDADLDAMMNALMGGAPGPGVPMANIQKSKGSKADAEAKLMALANQNPPCKKLFFHWTGHGNKDCIFWGDPPDRNQKMTYAELRNKLQGTNSQSFCVSIEACKSGGGVDELDDLPGDGVTSTDDKTNAGFTDTGSCFTKAFAGCLTSNGADSDMNGSVSYAEAKAWAVKESAKARGQKPQVWDADAAMDGVLDARYGEPVVVQTNDTLFGDSNLGLHDFANGSELDAGYVLIANGKLHLFLAGNLESNFNKLELFFDSLPGVGQNRLLDNNPDVDFNGLNRMGGPVSGNLGLTFDEGVAPDFWIGITGGDIGGGNYRLFANYAELLTFGGGQGYFLGGTEASNTGFLVDGFNPFNIRATIDNSNTGGVGFGPGPNPVIGSEVRSGIEIEIELAALGLASPAPIIVTAFINGGGHDFVSNQVLGGIGNGPNLGEPRQVRFDLIPGDQFFLAVPPVPPCPADANGDGLTNGADLSVLLSQFGDPVPPGTGADFNGDGLVNGADLSVLLANFGCGT